MKNRTTELKLYAWQLAREVQQDGFVSGISIYGYDVDQKAGFADLSSHSSLKDIEHLVAGNSIINRFGEVVVILKTRLPEAIPAEEMFMQVLDIREALEGWHIALSDVLLVTPDDYFSFKKYGLLD